jgi:NAD(P)H-dependent flavin oxidoreductase YrpB (nitropropane dioxygenase family)
VDRVGQAKWPRTDFLDLLGIAHPIIQAPMGGFGGPALVAAFQRGRARIHFLVVIASTRPRGRKSKRYVRSAIDRSVWNFFALLHAWMHERRVGA